MILLMVMNSQQNLKLYNLRIIETLFMVLLIFFNNNLKGKLI